MCSQPSFTTVRGDLCDESSLDFEGSDGVLVMSPPKFDGSDLVSYTQGVASDVRAAVARAGSVTRLVYVSSVGAQHEEGVVRCIPVPRREIFLVTKLSGELGICCRQNKARSAPFLFSSSTDGLQDSNSVTPTS